MAPLPRWMLTVALGLGVAGMAGLAVACSCAKYASAAAQAAATDALFRGRVVSTAARGGEAETTFVIVESLKGPASGRIVVRHATGPASMCGTSYRPGQTFEVGAIRRAGGRWVAGPCSAPQFPWEQLREAAMGAAAPSLS